MFVKTSNKSIGFQGENLACQYLRKTCGFTILNRNWKNSLGELDLVARNDEGAYIFVEVKTRKFPDDGLEAIQRDKRRRIHRLALSFLKSLSLPLETPVRFDIILVDKHSGHISHYPEAFEAEQELL